MRNTFNMSRIDAICFIAHNYRMSNKAISSLTGTTPEWVAEVRERMGSRVGTINANGLDCAYDIVRRFMAAKNDVTHTAYMLEEAKATYRATSSPADNLVMRWRNNKHDLAIEQYGRMRDIFKGNMKMVRMLYELNATPIAGRLTEILAIDTFNFQREEDRKQVFHNIRALLLGSICRTLLDWLNLDKETTW